MSFLFRSETEVNTPRDDVAFDLAGPQLDLMVSREVVGDHMDLFE